MSKPGSRRWLKVLGIVVAVLTVVVAVGVLALDRILISVAKKETATLSQELSRPISLQGIAVKLWGGLGVKVTGVSVGPGPGEKVQLLELPRAEVSVGVFRALRSGGKEILVNQAVIHGLRVNVEKLADGTTNVDRLLRKLEERSAKQAPAQPAPEQPAEKTRPPALELGRAAVEDARFAFLDRTVPGAKELFVDHFDAEIRDLRVGKPLELVVKAAVLADQQNLELRVRAAPLPPSLLAVPEQVTLKVQPVDLTPLAPFLPRSVGLQGGRFQSDLQVALGAAVPGGTGETKLLGGFRATQLAFAGQAGGKRLDASLDANLTADPRAGSLALEKLELVVGPATLSGRGRASGLLGASPRVEGLEITSRGLDPAALTEYYPPLRKQMGGVVVAGPVGLSVRGQGSATAQRIDVRVDLTPVRLVVPHQLEKAAGAPMVLTAGVDAAQGGGRIRFDTDLDLAGVDLRPGGSVAKKPGDPMSIKVAGAYQKIGDGLEVAISQLVLNLLGDPLLGKGQVKLAGAGKSRTTRFDAELSGDRLDVDRLLLQKPAEKRPAPAPKSSAPDPGPFAGLSGEARLKLGLLRVKGTEARNVLATIKVKEDTVSLEQAQLQAFGGSVNAAGTLFRLAHPDEPFKVMTKVKGVEAGQALGLFTSQKVLSGSLDAEVELHGPGLGKVDLLKALTGVVQGDLRGGVFHGKDLIASVAGPLAGKLPFANKKVADGGSTSLGKDLPFAVKIVDGVAQLTKPIRFDTGQGEVELTGGIRLDGTLQMPATVGLTPELIARITGGKVRPSAPVPLTFRLAGAVTSPRLDGLSVDAAAKSLASQAAAGALGKALSGLGGSGGEQGTGKEGKQESPKKQLESEAAKKLKGLFGK